MDSTVRESGGETDDSDEETSPPDTRSDSADSAESADSTRESGDSAPDTDTAAPPRLGVTLDLSPDLGAKLIGEEAGDSYYHASVVAGAGDVDADGLPDLLLGQPGRVIDGESTGGAYLVRGSPSGTLDLSLADARLLGIPDANWEQAGAAVAAAGDVDSDGYDDILVGAPNFNSTADYEGRAFLVRGPISGDMDLDAADAILNGDHVTEYYCETWSEAGSSVAGAGDVNGDGADDVLVGARYNDCGPGAAYLLYGPVSGTLYLATDPDVTIRGDAAWWGLGESVSSLGDADGDGLDDVLVGWSGGEWRVLVYEGFSGADLTPSDADAWVAEDPDVDIGFMPAAVGDVDGDGYVDLTVDAFGDDQGGEHAGAVRLFRGPFAGERAGDAPDAEMLGDHRWAVAGRAATVGDANGDGRSDLLIGAPDDGGPGTAYLVLGPVSGTMSLADADAVLNGEGDDGTGHSVAGPGDVDGDGLGDLLIAGWGDDDGGEDAGAAWLVYASSIWEE